MQIEYKQYEKFLSSNKSGSYQKIGAFYYANNFNQSLGLVPLLGMEMAAGFFFANEILISPPYYCIYPMIFAPFSCEKSFRVDLYTLEQKHA